jgi:hypothetical protein
VRVVASPEALGFVSERGGRLFVWTRTQRCCHGVTRLEAATEPPPQRRFRRVPADGLELYLPAGLDRLPDELVVEARGRRRRVEAYWDGCAWVA